MVRGPRRCRVSLDIPLRHRLLAALEAVVEPAQVTAIRTQTNGMPRR